MRPTCQAEGVDKGWNDLGRLPADAVSRQGATALGLKAPRLRTKGPHQVATWPRRWVEFIGDLGDHLLQRGKTALQVCLPDPQGVDLRLKITVTRPETPCSAPEVSRRTWVILVDGPLGMPTTRSGIAIAALASHAPSHVTRRQGHNADADDLGSQAASSRPVAIPHLQDFCGKLVLPTRPAAPYGTR
jgi:hypothetical protein